VALAKASELLPSLAESHLLLAELALQSQSPDQAIAAAQNVLKFHPEHALAYRVLGQAYVAKGDAAKALEHLKTATEKAPQDAKGYYYLGLGHQKRKQTREACAAFAKALELEPTLTEARSQMIVLCKEQGEQVAQGLGKALEQAPQNIRLHLHQAVLYIEQKKWAEAEATYKKASAIDPKDPLPLLALGDFYALITQKVDGGIATYKKAAALKPEAGLPKLIELAVRQNKLDEASKYADDLAKNAEGKTLGKFWKGRLTLMKGQSAEAIPLLQEVIQERPSLALAHHYLGVAFLANNNMPSAKTSFSEAIRLTPAFLDAHVALIRLLIQARTTDQAVSAAQHLLAQQPDNPLSYLVAGEAYLEHRDTNQAVATFKTAVEKAPQDARTHYSLGLAYLAQQKDTEALAAFEQAMSRNPHAVEPLAQIAGVAVRKGTPDKAIERVQTQLQLSPQNASMYTLLGQLHERKRNESEAEKAFKKALELDTGASGASIALANLYVRQKSYDPAIALYEDLLKRNPKLAGAHTAIGMIHDAKGERAKANESYQKALGIDPKFVTALNNLAWNYAEYGGNLNTALTYVQTARAVEPNNADVADTGGWVYYKLKDYANAVTWLKDSAEKSADNPVIRYHLGLAYYKKGELQAAKEALQEALRLSKDFPGSEDAKQTLAEIGLTSR